MLVLSYSEKYCTPEPVEIGLVPLKGELTSTLFCFFPHDLVHGYTKRWRFSVWFHSAGLQPRRELSCHDTVSHLSLEIKAALSDPVGTQTVFLHSDSGELRSTHAKISPFSSHYFQISVSFIKSVQNFMKRRDENKLSWRTQQNIKTVLMKKSD